MSSGTVEVCGNCGAPLDLDDEDECRWCHATIRVEQPKGPWGWPSIHLRWNGRIATIAAIAIAIPAGLGVGISRYAESHLPGPPAATSAGAAGAGQAVPPASTDLQALRQDFGPWRQIAGRPADSPALLLLQSGSAWASERWTVPSTAQWWALDLGGNITSAVVSGADAAITDADDVDYTVGVNQPFIVSSNPGTVLLIRPSGTVMSMSLAQATAVRQNLAR